MQEGLTSQMAEAGTTKPPSGRGSSLALKAASPASSAAFARSAAVGALVFGVLAAFGASDAAPCSGATAVLRFFRPPSAPSPPQCACSVADWLWLSPQCLNFSDPGEQVQVLQSF